MNEELRNQIDAWVAEGFTEDEIIERLRSAPSLPAPGDSVGAALARHGGPTRDAAAETEAEGAFTPPREGAGISGFLRTAAQGPTFGFGDEIEGVVRAAGALVPGGRSPREAFREGVGAARQDIQTFREDHPVGSLATEIAGGLAGGGIGALRSGGAAVGRGALRRLLSRPMAKGAIEGAVAGAGAAEGSPGDRVAGAVGGGVLGGATGGLIQGVGALRGARGRAQGRLAAVLEREGLDPATALRKLGEGQTLMDLGETAGPLQRLARAAQSIPSEGSERIRRTLRDRAASAPDRIRRALQRDAKLTFEDAVQTVDELMEQRAAKAAPLYREAYKYDVSDDVVRGLFDEREFQRAYRLAQQTAAQEVAARRALEAGGQAIPPDLADVEVLPELFRIAEDGSAEFITRSIPVRALDYMKSALQEVVDHEIAGGRLSRRGAMMLQRKLDAFLSRVDELVPEYAEARAQFAGFSRAREVFEAARSGSRERGLKKFLTEDPRRIAKALREMTPSEREFYRRGALDAVREQLEKSADNRDLTKVLFGNSEARKRLRTLFESEADFNRFRDTMMRERRMADAQSFILGGSPTARIQAEQQDLVGREFRLSDATRPLEFVRKVLDEGVSARLRAGGERTVDELAPLLTATGPAAAAAVGDELMESLRREAIRNAVLSAVSGGAAVPAGLAAGRATVP